MMISAIGLLASLTVGSPSLTFPVQDSGVLSTADVERIVGSMSAALVQYAVQARACDVSYSKQLLISTAIIASYTAKYGTRSDVFSMLRKAARREIALHIRLPFPTGREPDGFRELPCHSDQLKSLLNKVEGGYGEFSRLTDQRERASK